MAACPIFPLSEFEAVNPAVVCCFVVGDDAGPSDADLLALGAAAVVRQPFEPADLARRLWGLVGADEEREVDPAGGEPRILEPREKLAHARLGDRTHAQGAQRRGELRFEHLLILTERGGLPRRPGFFELPAGKRHPGRRCRLPPA